MRCLLVWRRLALRSAPRLYPAWPVGVARLRSSAQEAAAAAAAVSLAQVVPVHSLGQLQFVTGQPQAPQLVAAIPKVTASLQQLQSLHSCNRGRSGAASSGAFKNAPLSRSNGGCAQLAAVLTVFAGLLVRGRWCAWSSEPLSTALAERLRVAARPQLPRTEMLTKAPRETRPAVSCLHATLDTHEGRTQRAPAHTYPNTVYTRHTHRSIPDAHDD